MEFHLSLHILPFIGILEFFLLKGTLQFCSTSKLQEPCFLEDPQFAYDRYVFCAYNQSIQESHLNSSCHGDDMNFLHLHSLSLFPVYLPSTNHLLCCPFPLQIINNVSQNEHSTKTCSKVLENLIVENGTSKLLQKKFKKKQLVIRC
jgi:hypothetical protein